MDNPILASATLKVIKQKIKKKDSLYKYIYIFTIKKILNINISKIINKIIKWYQILQKRTLKNIIIKVINKYSLDVISIL